MANPLAAIIAKRVAGKVAKTAGKNAGAGAKASQAGAKATKSTASAGASTAKATANAGRGMRGAAKSPGMFKKFLGAGAVGGGLFGLSSLFDMFSGGDDEAAAGEADTGGVASTPIPSSTATATSTGLMLFDFASMLDNKMLPVPKLPEVVIDEADLPYVDATLDADVAIPYDIEEMFDKERGSLIIPRGTYLDFSSDKIKGLTAAVLRLAKNQDLINQQIGILNNKTAALEQAIETAQDLNRRAILDYNRQQDEEALEDGAPGTDKPKTGFIAEGVEAAKTAAKVGLAALGLGAVGAALAVGGTILGDWLDDPEQEADQAYQDALDSGATEEEAARAYQTALEAAEDETWADEVATAGGLAVTGGAGVATYKAGQKGVEKLASSKVGQKVGMKTAAQKAEAKAAQKAQQEIAEAGGRMMATEFGEAGAKTTTKAIGKEVGEAAGKKVGKSAITAAISKVAPKKLTALAGKAVPGISWLVGGAIAVAQLAKGDYAGASLTAASSVAGAATAIPLITIEIAREVYNAVYGNPEGETTYEKFPHEWDAANPEESGYVENIGVIKDATAEWVAEWFESNAEYPQDEESLKSAIEKGIYDHDYVGDSEVDLSRVSELTVEEMKAIIAEDDIDEETKEVLQKQISTREEQVKPQPVEEVGGLKVGSVDRPSELRGKEIPGSGEEGSSEPLTIERENFIMDFEAASGELEGAEQALAAFKAEHGEPDTTSIRNWGMGDFQFPAYSDPKLQEKFLELNKQVTDAEYKKEEMFVAEKARLLDVDAEELMHDPLDFAHDMHRWLQKNNIPIPENTTYGEIVRSFNHAVQEGLYQESDAYFGEKASGGSAAEETVETSEGGFLDTLSGAAESAGEFVMSGGLIGMGYRALFSDDDDENAPLEQGETAIYNSMSDAKKAGEELGGAYRIVPIEDEDGDDTGQYSVTATNSKSSADNILDKAQPQTENSVVVVPIPQRKSRAPVAAEMKPAPLGMVSKSRSASAGPTIRTKDSWFQGAMDPRS